MGWPGRSALRSSERCAWADTHRSTSSAPATHGSTSVARADSAATWDVALVPASMCMVRQTPPGPSRPTPSWTARAGTRDGVTEPSTWTEVLSAAATVQVHISLLPPHIGQDEGIRPWSHRSEPGRSKSLAMERRHSLPRGYRPQICVGGRGGPVLKPSLRQSRKDMSYSCTMPGKTASNGGAASRNVATPTVPGASRPGSRPAPLQRGADFSRVIGAEGVGRWRVVRDCAGSCHPKNTAAFPALHRMGSSSTSRRLSADNSSGMHPGCRHDNGRLP